MQLISNFIEPNHCILNTKLT